MENEWNKLLTVDWAGHYGKDIFKNSYTFRPAKLRNQMLIKMLDSLLRIRLRFYSKRTCCQTFIPTPQIIADFNYKIVYPQELPGRERALQEEFEFEIIDLLESYDIPTINIENTY